MTQHRLAAGAWQNVDLLRRRRNELGVVAIAPAPAQGLLWRGALIGLALVSVGGAGWLGIFAWLRVLDAREQALQPVAVQHQELQNQLAQLTKQLEQAKTANRSLADAILSIPSGALLLADLAVRTPRTIQLSSARQEGKQLTISGVATQPDALRAINAFQLELERSPLFDPNQVELLKVQQEQQQQSQLPASASAVAPGMIPLGFEIKAAMAPMATKANLPRLRVFGAMGLLRRLDVLQQEGLLQ